MQRELGALADTAAENARPGNDHQPVAIRRSALFFRLGFRDYARFDFRCGSDGLPRLLDANANPNWTADGKMATMAGWAGYGYSGLLRLILEAAVQRTGLA